MPHLARSSRIACRLLLLGGVLALPSTSKAQLPPALLPPGWQDAATMKPAPITRNAPTPVTPLESASLETFDPRAVQLSWHDRRWLLTHQGRTLKDFGTHVEDAKLALRLIHELGLNQRAVIGSPVPHLEYWLVDGHAPGALPRSGMHTFPLEPARLRVEKVQTQWCIRDAQRVLFNFGSNPDEARQALAAFQNYHFTEVGFVGQVMPSMIVFGGRGQGDTPTMSATHGAGATGRQFAPQKFSRLATNSDGTPRFEHAKQTPTIQAVGYEGVVQPLIPPLFAPANVRANASGDSATLPSTRSTAWHDQPHFGRQQPAQATPAGQEARHAFDWRQVQMRQDNGVWKIAAGSQALASFGNLLQAQMAMATIRYYRFNELRAVSGEEGSSYFLAQATNARGVMPGLKGTEFQPEKLEIQHQPAGYAICQGSRVILQFRDRPEPARQALEAIQRQKLDRLCHVGEQDKERITIVVRSR